MMFENEVLKKIPENVKIGLSDWSKESNSANEIKDWIKKYNVQYYQGKNTSCLYHFVEAKSLKVIDLWHFPYCNERDLNVFLQLKNLHSLVIGFKINLE